MENLKLPTQLLKKTRIGSEDWNLSSHDVPDAEEEEIGSIKTHSRTFDKEMLVKSKIQLTADHK